MDSSMLVFEKDDFKFNYRSVAVIIHEGNVLLHQIADNPYWSLPGGRVEFMESAADAVIREIKEELQVDCRIIRPLWVIENFFTYKQKQVHEIAFYFLVTSPAELLERGRDFLYFENGVKLHFAWVRLETVSQVELYPAFLRTALNKLPQTLEYVVSHG